MQLLDDDGVLVLASENAMRARFAGRRFDYAFPKELLAASTDGGAVAWQLGQEGEHEIDVLLESTETRSASLCIHCDESCELWLMPYSTFTMGSDAGGNYERIDGLLGVVRVPASGWYAVELRRVGRSRLGGLQLKLTLKPWPKGKARPLDEVPKV